MSKNKQHDDEEMKPAMASVPADPLELRVAKLEDEVRHLLKYLRIPPEAVE